MPYFMSNEIFNRIKNDSEVSSVGYYDMDGTFFYVWERRESIIIPTTYPLG